MARTSSQNQTSVTFSFPPSLDIETYQRRKGYEDTCSQQDG